MSKYSIAALNAEFGLVLTYFNDHHTNMRNCVNYYLHSAFYLPSKGEKIPKNTVAVNYLKAFADKNVNYTSSFPTIKVPAPASDQALQKMAELNEKILYATHEENGTPVLQKKWALDGTLMSEAFAETTFDLKTRRVNVKRLDPRFCYYKMANQNDDKIEAFWFAYPMSIAEIKAEFGKDVQPGSVTANGVDPNGDLVMADDTERAWVIKRWDAETMVMWAGNEYIVKPHKHLMPVFPIDRCVPFTDIDPSRFPQFFLDPLVGLQAEINDTMRKKRLINTRLANVPVIVKGIAANQVDRVKEAILSGGFIGLKTGGDAQFLQLTETAALNEHMADCFQKMKDISGYSTVTFGEIAGANTSGDAVSMYFQPTTQTAQNQWIGWKAFYESINEKILRLYEKFGTSKEMFKLYGVVPRTTFEVVEGKIKAKPSSFMIEFNGAQIGGYYRSQIIVPQVTPKDEVAYKRLVGDMAVAGFLPKVTAYDEWGYTDPQEQIDLLAQEQSNPALNPEGMSKLINTLPQDPMGGMPVDAGMGLGGENVGLAQENGLAGIQ